MVPRSFVVFAASGVFGFLVDSGVFYVADKGLENPYLARCCSYMAAATTTWLVNRRYAFASGSLLSTGALVLEWSRYLLTQLSGFAVNYGVFSVLIYSIAFFASYPILAIAVGSGAGLMVNYTAARLLVFRPAVATESSPSARANPSFQSSQESRQAHDEHGAGQ